jgi:hypothetical protein
MSSLPLLSAVSKVLSEHWRPDTPDAVIRSPWRPYSRLVTHRTPSLPRWNRRTSARDLLLLRRDTELILDSVGPIRATYSTSTLSLEDLRPVSLEAIATNADPP